MLNVSDSGPPESPESRFEGMRGTDEVSTEQRYHNGFWPPSGPPSPESSPFKGEDKDNRIAGLPVETGSEGRPLRFPNSGCEAAGIVRTHATGLSPEL